jgi:alpha-glucosidase
VSEVHVFDLSDWALYYGAALDEFHMPFNFHLMVADWNADSVRHTIESVLSVVPQGATTNWTLGNHDEHRIISRLGPGNARLAAMLLLTLPGAVFMYYGDEIGMRQTTIDEAHARDPWGRNVSYLSRDGCRTPMQWNSDANGGFTTGTPWLPVNADYETTNVEAELSDPASMLSLYTNLLGLRHRSPALASADLRMHDASNDHVLVFERRSGDGSETVTVALNFSTETCDVPGVSGNVAVSTFGDPPAAPITGLELRPHEGVIVRAS